METATQSLTSRWGGGVSPFGIYWQKMMMWWFIVGDAILFAAFLASYGFSRLGTANWPDQSEAFDLNLITLMTFVLISSSATMATAVTAARAGDPGKARKFLGLTLLGGLVFLGMQAYEWSHIIGLGGTLTENPWGVPAFTAYFFMVTGFHGTHVLIGVIINLIIFLKQVRGTGTPNGVELAGLYWHFVDLVWVFIFGCFYLI